MNHLPPSLIIFFLGCLFFTFPGVSMVKYLRETNILQRTTATIYLSLSFWVCITWFISWCHLPLGSTIFALAGLSVVWYLVQLRKQGQRPERQFKPGFHHLVLTAALLLLCYPLLFLTIPPGCDTSMHGYIARLIINNNGLPHSYRPVLPVDYFGSYSAGYHVLTALFAGMQVPLLRHAVNFISVISYPLALLGIVYFLRQFFSDRIAIYTTVIYWGLNSTLQGTIGWGGNPTMLAFGSCMFCAGAILHAVKDHNSAGIRTLAITAAAIPLIHAIPAITLAYIALPGFIALLMQYKDRAKWIAIQGISLAGIAIMLLLPFLLHFRNEHSPELTTMIRHWQNQMMGMQLTNNFGSNVLVTLDQIKYRTGDLPTILAGIAMVFLLVVKQYRPVVITLLFLTYIFVLMFNYGYWFLPGSELLYPERIVFFMIIGISFFLGFSLHVLEQKQWGFSVAALRVPVYMLPVLVLLTISLCWTYNKANALKASNIQCDPATVAGFDWIRDHTGPDAMCVASYNDAGMWIPAFTNRPTLGCHMHFIHEVMHIPDTLNAYTGPRYYFITMRDIKDNTEIMARIKDKKLLFSNSTIHIYQ